MSSPADLAAVPVEARTQPAFDLFLIFAGANIVATTLQVGATLAGEFTPGQALPLVVVGSLGGAALVAALAPIGPRLGAPSVIAARAALGRHGAALVALLLFVTNFAWIAINNVIAASAVSAAFPDTMPARLWTAVMGLVATAVVAQGPRLVGIADRAAVPLMAAIGVVVTIAAVRAAPAAGIAGPPPAAASWLRGFDIVVGYQVSWILMFADYSRYTRSAGRGAAAVFAGLALPSLWLMPVGVLAASTAASADPGSMLAAIGLGGPGAVLLALATVTTNFVNIYLSSLAWKSLVPATPDRTAVWSIGLVGIGIGLLSSGWLDRYAGFMLLLGSLLVPVGGLLLARFFLVRRPVSVADLYDAAGPLSRIAASASGLAAWAAGAVVYHLAASVGSTLPSLVTAAVTYVALDRWWGPAARAAIDP